MKPQDATNNTAATTDQCFGDIEGGRSYEKMSETRSQENILSSFDEMLGNDENIEDFPIMTTDGQADATIVQQKSTTHKEFAEGRRRAFTEVQENIIVEGSDDDSFHSRNVRRRRAFSDMELRSEIRELKNNLLKQTLEDCNML